MNFCHYIEYRYKRGLTLLPVPVIFHFQCQTLREDLREQRTSRDYVNKTGNDLIKKSSPGEKAEKLEQDLKAVNKMWSEVSTAMEERLRYLEESIEQLKEYEVFDMIRPGKNG